MKVYVIVENELSVFFKEDVIIFYIMLWDGIVKEYFRNYIFI